jgi:hypothetical protein
MKQFRSRLLNLGGLKPARRSKGKGLEGILIKPEYVESEQ